jgi:hypothetical protein
VVEEAATTADADSVGGGGGRERGSLRASLGSTRLGSTGLTGGGGGGTGCGTGTGGMALGCLLLTGIVGMS